jgi:hypothetical protein
MPHIELLLLAFIYKIVVVWLVRFDSWLDAQLIAFMTVARAASSYTIVPCGLAAFGNWQHVIQGCNFAFYTATAILALAVIP